MYSGSKMKNNFGFYAFFFFALGFILHTCTIYGYIPQIFTYIIFGIYMISAWISIWGWIRHFKGRKMGYANMILAGLSIMPIFIGITIYIRLMMRR